MTDLSDQTVAGSTCMFYRRQSRGVLLKNKCDVPMVFAVVQKSNDASDQQTTTTNVSVAAKSEDFRNTGGSDNVISVGIGS